MIWNRGRKGRRVTAVLGAPLYQEARPPAVVNLGVISREELERQLTAFFSHRGYTVWPTSARGEVGAALLLCRDEQGVVVQVKLWNAPLGREVVSAALDGVRGHADMLRRLGCSRIGGLVVSNTSFKPGARELAGRSGLLLWDRDALQSQLLCEVPPRDGLGLVTEREARQPGPAPPAQHRQRQSPEPRRSAAAITPPAPPLRASPPPAPVGATSVSAGAASAAERRRRP